MKLRAKKTEDKTAGTNVPTDSAPAEKVLTVDEKALRLLQMCHTESNYNINKRALVYRGNENRILGHEVSMAVGPDGKFFIMCVQCKKEFLSAKSRRGRTFQRNYIPMPEGSYLTWMENRCFVVAPKEVSLLCEYCRTAEDRRRKEIEAEGQAMQDRMQKERERAAEEAMTAERMKRTPPKLDFEA